LRAKLLKSELLQRLIRCVASDPSPASTPAVRLKREQRTAIVMLASGATLTAAADFAGVDRRTIYRWRLQREFIAELQRQVEVNLSRELDRLRKELLLYIIALEQEVLAGGNIMGATLVLCDLAGSLPKQGLRVDRRARRALRHASMRSVAADVLWRGRVGIFQLLRWKEAAYPGGWPALDGQPSATTEITRLLGREHQPGVASGSNRKEEELTTENTDGTEKSLTPGRRDAKKKQTAGKRRGPPRSAPAGATERSPARQRGKKRSRRHEPAAHTKKDENGT
jgi:hypothetical protein